MSRQRTCPTCEKEYSVGNLGSFKSVDAFTDDPSHKTCNSCYKKKNPPKKVDDDA